MSHGARGTRLFLLLIPLAVAACDSATPGHAAQADAARLSAKLRSVRAYDFDYRVVDVAGARDTRVYRMTEHGDIVGYYVDDAKRSHGFILNDAGLRAIDVPEATSTETFSLNDRGDVVGAYADAEGHTHGFLLGAQGMVTIDFPGASSTIARDVNARGDVVGEYELGNQRHGFLWRDGEFTSLRVPGAHWTAAVAINGAGDVSGHYHMGPGTSMASFVRRGNQLTTYTHPAKNLMSCAWGIADDGRVVGHSQDEPTRLVLGFVWRDGEFSARFGVPDAKGTYPSSITRSGMLAGYFEDGDGRSHGFVATPRSFRFSSR